MIPLHRISAARAEHQTTAGAWVLVMKLRPAHVGRILVAYRGVIYATVRRPA